MKKEEGDYVRLRVRVYEWKCGIDSLPPVDCLLRLRARESKLSADLLQCGSQFSQSFIWLWLLFVCMAGFFLY